MKRSDFYDDRRKVRKINFLADYRTVRKYFLRRYDIKQAEFELILKLHDVEFIAGRPGTFVKEDFISGEVTANWNEDRWLELRKNDEWIRVVRERKPSQNRNFAIFGLSDKAKSMVNYTYEILCGEKPIPETKQHNPIMKRETYSDKTYATAIIEFNKAMAAKRNRDA